ncbi:hypothetical protein CC78DRAFT_571739 [Lojkania enalia]|uniref:Uncharacterized protein n=1 Tax=Lojkania enalia TaxID=147567 RepID=A0A9P4K4Z5_9PLEO|nr:hypothetical protein CC78DRAFT_571739 [Didymosphaeria enalia]
MNLPWDSNPFFFKLYHKSTEDGGFITFTDDEIYGLDFGSPAYACWDDSGNPCGYYETSWEDLPEILLNLTTATATKTKVGGEEGYEVTGDETTYVQNTKEGASYNRVNVYDSCDELGLDFTDAFIWNDTFKWSYKIGLSNSTGSATIRSEIKGATLEITYTGERMTNSSMWLNVELVASDDSEPQFQFSNDSNIYFSEGISGKWSAAATPLPSGANPAGATFPTGSTLDFKPGIHWLKVPLGSSGAVADVTPKDRIEAVYQTNR